MRKFWFAYLAKALVVFPGGFGTLDEMMEILTLTQTQKLAKKMTILLYGSEYWKEIINFDALVKYGMISPEDLSLFQFADDPPTAFELLKTGLTTYALQHGHAGDAGDLEIGQPAEAGRGLRPRMFSRTVAPGIEMRLFDMQDAETHVRRRGAQSRVPARVAAVGGLHRRRRKTCGASSSGCASSSKRTRDRSAAIWVDGGIAGSVGCHPDRLAQPELQHRLLDGRSAIRARAS